MPADAQNAVGCEKFSTIKSVRSTSQQATTATNSSATANGRRMLDDPLREIAKKPDFVRIFVTQNICMRVAFQC
jgi:hypothetical protein